MPLSAPRPCPTPGCTRLVSAGHCEEHRREHSREVERRRASATERGYGTTWRKVSKNFLRAHPLCQCPDCDEGRVRVKASQVVDHIVPHRGDMALFWLRSNWQAMSKPCHDKKTAREDGGFGNRIARVED